MCMGSFINSSFHSLQTAKVPISVKLLIQNIVSNYIACLNVNN